MLTYTAVFLKRDPWIVAYIEEIPGVNTQGKTLDEAKANLKEALHMILEIRKEQSLEIEGELLLRESIAI